MSEIPPKIDLTKIPFPSDRLSIGTLRRLHPDLFDKSEAMAGTFFDDTEPFENMTLLVNLERGLADRLFDNAAAGRVPTGHVSRDASLDDLFGSGGRRVMSYWQQFGLAAGPHEAQELLRDLTTAVLVQAQQHVGKGKA